MTKSVESGVVLCIFPANNQAQAQQVMLQQMRPGGSMFMYYLGLSLTSQPSKGFCDTYKDNQAIDDDVGWIVTAIAGARR
jgi:hypothetical protein